MADILPDFDNLAKPITSGVVAIGPTPTKLSVGVDLDRLTEYIIIENLGTDIVFIGQGAVTDGSGLRLRRNQKATLSCKKGSPFFGIIGSGSNNVFIVEMGS